MVEIVRMAVDALRHPDRLHVEGIIDGSGLNHVERKILAWSIMDGVCIASVADRLHLSQTRVKHLKRGALERVADFISARGAR